jgi:hypothetical protein
VIPFKHSGALGDIVYSLPAILTILNIYNGGSATIYIPNNKSTYHGPGVNHPGGKYMMNQALFDFILPLLTRQAFIENVFFVAEEEIPGNAIDMDVIRHGMINVGAGNIKDYYFKAFGLVSRKSAPWLHVDQADNANGVDIVIGRSTRYLNQGINYSQLNELNKTIGFVGSDFEFKTFTERVSIDGIRKLSVDNALDACRLIHSAKLFIGNQSLFFALAEGLQSNRILESFELVPNVVPQGGQCGQYITTSGFVKLLNQFFETSLDEHKFPAPPQYIVSL